MLPDQNVHKTEKSKKTFPQLLQCRVSTPKTLYKARLHARLAQNENGSATWWHLLKRLSRVAIPKPPNAKLLQDEVTANTDTKKVQLLARFFAGQWSGEPLNEYLDIGAPYPSKINQPIFDFQQIKESLVLHLLQTLPMSKASDCIVLTNRVL